MLQDVWRLGAAKLVLTHDGRIAVLNFSGLLTLEALSGLIRQAADAYGGHTAGWLSDFTEAVLLIDAEDLTRITLSAPPDSVLRRPGAFVVCEGVRDMMRAHSSRVSRAGFWRRTFTGKRTAHEWLRQMLENA